MKKVSILLSDYEKDILVAIARLAEKGYKMVGHRELAVHFEEDNPKLFNCRLKSLREKGLLRYRGHKQNQHWYSITNDGLRALSISKTTVEQKMKIKEKTKHLGITTTEKETVVSPIPSSLETESQSSIAGGVGVSQSNIQGSYTQKDKKKLEFEKAKSHM